MTKVTVCEPQLKFIAQYRQYTHGCFFPDWLNSYENFKDCHPASQLHLFVFHIIFSMQIALSQPASQFCFDKHLMFYHTPPVSVQLLTTVEASYAIQLPRWLQSCRYSKVVRQLGAKILQVPTLVSQLNFKLSSFI